MNCSCCYDHIYIVKSFLNKRSRTPINSSYYKDVKDTEYIFDTCIFADGLVRVEYAKVCKNSNAYELAVFNSATPEEKKKLTEEKEKINLKSQIIQDLQNHLSQH